MRIIDYLKKIPIDFGQGAVAERTEGKQIALRLVSPGQGRRALDVGCRQGQQTRWLKERGYRVCSIDIECHCPGCMAVDANQPLPFEDQSFDLIWCSEVIEHLQEPAAVIGEFRRLLRPGGEMIITTPNSYALIFRFLACFGLTPQRLQRADHLHFFNYTQVRHLFPDADIYGYFPYAFLKHTIGRRVGELSPTFVIHAKEVLGDCRGG
jgi:2-polyprenyl-3-methyl-5-hydroxy-6-metoxy-1,4-benzoquinol methylase